MNESNTVAVMEIMSLFMLVFAGGIASVGICWGVLKYCSAKKQFVMAFCHHKREAAMLVRWMQIFVRANCDGQLLIDSDHFGTLDTLLGSVAYDSSNLVVILTHGTLSQISCVSQVAAAWCGKVPILKVHCQDFQPPQHEIVDFLVEEIWSLEHIALMSFCGIGKEYMKEGFLKLNQEELVFDLNRHEPEDQHESIMASVMAASLLGKSKTGLFGKCKSMATSLTSTVIKCLETRAGLRFRDRRSTGNVTTDVPVLILANANDVEAKATMFVLQRLLMELELSVAAEGLLHVSSNKVSSKEVLLILTEGVLEKAAIAGTVAEAHKYSSRIFTTLTDINFTFPSEMWFQDLVEERIFTPQQVAAAGTGVSLQDIGQAYAAMVKTVPFHLSTQRSLQVMQVEVTMFIPWLRRTGQRRLPVGPLQPANAPPLPAPSTTEVGAPPMPQPMGSSQVAVHPICASPPQVGGASLSNPAPPASIGHACVRGRDSSI